jgi:hypothetical protein
VFENISSGKFVISYQYNGNVFGCSTTVAFVGYSSTYNFTGFKPPIPANATDTKYLLVFRGKLGAENDAVSAKSFKNIVMAGPEQGQSLCYYKAHFLTRTVRTQWQWHLWNPSDPREFRGDIVNQEDDHCWTYDEAMELLSKQYGAINWVPGPFFLTRAYDAVMAVWAGEYPGWSAEVVSVYCGPPDLPRDTVKSAIRPCSWPNPPANFGYSHIDVIMPDGTSATKRVLLEFEALLDSAVLGTYDDFFKYAQLWGNFPPHIHKYDDFLYWYYYDKGNRYLSVSDAYPGQNVVGSDGNITNEGWYWGGPFTLDFTTSNCPTCKDDVLSYYPYNGAKRP